LPSSAFAEPSKRKYPLDTKNRARNAEARVSQKVRGAVKRKFPSIGKKRGGK